MIADPLGHRSTTTTEVYVHSNPEVRRENMALALPADFDELNETRVPDQVTLSRDLVERAIKSARSPKVRKELKAALDG